MIVKNFIKVWRAKNNITQEKLGNAIGMSRQSINAIERGKFTPSILTALKMAAYFNTEVENIFYIEDISEKESSSSTSKLKKILGFNNK